MAFKNSQMKPKNMLDGIRGCAVVLTYEEAFKNVTWDTIHARFITEMEYGWTKFPDVLIIVYFIKNWFVQSRTADEIGYNGRATSAIVKRLKRMNVLSILAIHDAMVDNGLIDAHHMKHVFEQDIPCKSFSGRRPHQVYNNDIFRFFTKSIITDAMAKAKGKRKSGKPKMRNVGLKFGIKTKVVKYWLEQEVTDIRVIAG